MEYKNFSKGVLAAELLDTGTSLTITTTETFPTGQFKAVIWDAGETEPQNDSTREIMTLEWNGSEYDIVGREQEDTTAKTWAEGSNIAHIVTAEQYEGFEVTDNKTTSFQATPDDTKYPTEKLVKDSLDDKAETANAMGSINHGADADTARPTGYYSITWIGESEPQNAENNDIWINTT